MVEIAHRSLMMGDYSAGEINERRRPPVGEQRVTRKDLYWIKSHKTDHMAMHKRAALKNIAGSDRTSHKWLAHPKKK
jgi:hypothetical protein